MLLFFQNGRNRNFAVVLLAILFPWHVPAAQHENFSAAEYREDVEAFREAVKARHVDPFATLPEDEFDRRLDALSDMADNLTFLEFVVGLTRVGAALREGHTGLRPTSDDQLDLPMLPVELWPTTDGWTVLAAPREHAVLLGKRLTHIAGVSIEELAKGVLPLFPRDSEAAAPNAVDSLVRAPDLLEAAGLIGSAELAQQITVEGPDGSLHYRLNAVSEEGAVGPAAPESWVTVGEPVPLWLRNRRLPWWRTTIDDGRTLYFQFNSADTGADKEWDAAAFQAFSNALAQEVTHDPTIIRLVVDLRWNDGGSWNDTRGLLADLLSTNRFQKRGSLFVITSAVSFSAALRHLSALEDWLDPIIVGTPGAGRPGHRAELARFRLPNTQVQVRVSVVKQTDSTEHRPSYFPHLYTPFSSSDLRASLDPALEAILGFDPQRDLESEITAALQEGAAAAVARYGELRLSARCEYVFEEPILNRIGYNLLLQEEQPGAALAIFQLNAREYPYSPNVYDSMADAYRALGRNAEAAANYRKAMSIDKRYTYALPTVRELESTASQ
jgi:hypothetical protein